MERKVYGDEPSFKGPRMLSNDPEFVTDSQNNDEYYMYDTDVRTGNLSGDMD